MQLCKCVRFPGTGITDSCKLPCGCWELNQVPLKEQPMVLTAEPSLQFQLHSFKNYYIPGHPGTSSVGQAGLELRDLPASDS